MREGEAEKQVLYVIEGIVLLNDTVWPTAGFHSILSPFHTVLLTESLNLHIALLSTKAYIT